MDIHHAANRLRQKRQKEIDATRESLNDATREDLDDAGIDGLADLAQAALIKVFFFFFFFCVSLNWLPLLLLFSIILYLPHSATFIFLFLQCNSYLRLHAICYTVSGFELTTSRLGVLSLNR